MTIEVFSIATEPMRGLPAYLRSLAEFQVPVTLLEQGEPFYRGHGWKWKTFVRAAQKSTADVVIHSDAYDVLCVDGLKRMEEKFRAFNHPIVFSFEPHAQPEFWLHLNSGLMMANRLVLLETFNARVLDDMFPDHFNDQFQIQSLYSWKPNDFVLDRNGALFHTISPRTPDLVELGGRLLNPATGESPCFVHAPGRGDLSKVEEWLGRIAGSAKSVRACT